MALSSGEKEDTNGEDIGEDHVDAMCDADRNKNNAGEDDDLEPEEEGVSAPEGAEADREQDAPKDELPAEISIERPADAASVNVTTDALGTCLHRLCHAVVCQQHSCHPYYTAAE